MLPILANHREPLGTSASRHRNAGRNFIAFIVGSFVIAASAATGCSAGGACAGTLTDCGGLCFDLQTSAEHCGTCNIACSSGQSCQRGACTSSGNDGGTTLPDSGGNPGTDPCRNVTQGGVYCGTSTQGNFDATKADPQTLYICNNGATSSTQSCGAPGCGDGGAASYCMCPCWEGAGDYCGSAIQTYSSNNGSCGTVQGGASPNSLYTCSGVGAWTLKSACVGSCVVNAGATDTCFCPGGQVCGSLCCKPTDSCGYCGAGLACNSC